MKEQQEEVATPSAPPATVEPEKKRGKRILTENQIKGLERARAAKAKKRQDSARERKETKERYMRMAQENEALRKQLGSMKENKSAPKRGPARTELPMSRPVLTRQRATEPRRAPSSSGIGWAF